MKTPKEYTDNIAKGIITEQMLSDCLFSVNKRAKNCRDKVREYRQYYRDNRYAYDKYNTIERYNDQKEAYYEQKSILLSVLNPVEIHREFLGYERRRIYEYDKDYEENRNKFVWENCYYDHKKDMEIWFGDVEDKTKPKINYYFLYDVGGKTFHSPVSEQNLNEYGELEIKDIDQLKTKGIEIGELVSTQFVNKVISLIESGNYRYAKRECDLDEDGMYCKTEKRVKNVML